MVSFLCYNHLSHLNKVVVRYDRLWWWEINTTLTGTGKPRDWSVLSELSVGPLRECLLCTTNTHVWSEPVLSNYKLYIIFPGLRHVCASALKDFVVYATVCVLGMCKAQQHSDCSSLTGLYVWTRSLRYSDTVPVSTLYVANRILCSDLHHIVS